jgi:hypothetical protein
MPRDQAESRADEAKAVGKRRWGTIFAIFGILILVIFW